MPFIIQQYQYFSQFENEGHSHRWIVWQFFNNLRSLSGAQEIIQETIAKNVSLPAATCSDSRVFRACPLFPLIPCTDAPQAFEPVNLNRDLYIPIWIRDTRFVLALQETDPALAEKTKELFWILFAQAVKERSVSRAFYWLLFAIALFLFGLAFIDNVAKALLGKGLFHYLGVLSDWIRSCIP